jgi:hypothetical protein
MLIESRLRTYESSEAREDLVGQPAEDDGDTCQVAWDTYGKWRGTHGVRYSRVVWTSKSSMASERS